MSEADNFKNILLSKQYFGSLQLEGDQQRHNPLAYKMYIISFNTELAMHFSYAVFKYGCFWLFCVQKQALLPCFGP